MVQGRHVQYFELQSLCVTMNVIEKELNKGWNGLKSYREVFIEARRLSLSDEETNDITNFVLQ